MTLAASNISGRAAMAHAPNSGLWLCDSCGNMFPVRTTHHTGGIVRDQDWCPRCGERDFCAPIRRP